MEVLFKKSDPVTLCAGNSKIWQPADSTNSSSNLFHPNPQKKVSKREQSLISVGVDIACAPPEDLLFSHSILCQIGLPRSEFTGNRYERKSGRAALMIEAGYLWDGKQFVLQRVPFGSMARLILAWINALALRNGDPEVVLGRSASDFLRMIGKNPNGGEKGSFKPLISQIQALSACTITLGFNNNGLAKTTTGQPVKDFEAWIGAQKNQRRIWPKSVTLGEAYFKTLQSHAVPLDLRAYSALQDSSLAMDLYSWLSYRLTRLNAELTLSWRILHDQLGQGYTKRHAVGDFKTEFLKALQKVLVVYPTANVTKVYGGLLLKPSPPPVHQKSRS